MAAARREASAALAAAAASVSAFAFAAACDLASASASAFSVMSVSASASARAFVSAAAAAAARARAFFLLLFLGSGVGQRPLLGLPRRSRPLLVVLLGLGLDGRLVRDRCGVPGACRIVGGRFAGLVAGARACERQTLRRRVGPFLHPDIIHEATAGAAELRVRLERDVAGRAEDHRVTASTSHHGLVVSETTASIP